MDYDFRIVDVFAERPFCGNQLAVFMDARGLSASQMQALAREFNFAETTFVLPADDGVSLRSFRIFTPKAELPFAGHPTLGTAAVLAQQNLLGGGAQGNTFLQTASGAIRIDVTPLDGHFSAVFRLNREIERREGPPARAAAAALSMDPDNVIDVRYGSAGLPFCFIHLKDTKAVDAAVLDRSAWQDGFANTWAPNLYLFAGAFRSQARLYARMFAPALGVEEDPATGSASAALVGLLALQQEAREGTFDITIDQGVLMGRPSVIRASATKRDGALVEVAVGGGVVIVAQGTMSL